MRQKSKNFVILSVLLVILISAFALTACNKKQSSTDPNEIYKPLLNPGMEITDSMTADKNKLSVDSNAIKPYDAFKKLLNGLKISQGEVVKNFMKNGNDTLNQEVITTIEEKKENGQIVTTEIITKASLKLNANTPNDLEADESKVSIEVKSSSSSFEDGLVFGFYYQKGKLLFQIFDGPGKTLKPLYISDVQLNKIYYYFSRYGFDEYFRKIATDILSGDITLNVDGNSIKLLEFLGPVIFPIIFNTEVKVSPIPENPELTMYEMGFNLGKFVNKMLPVIAKAPALVEDLLGDKLDEIGSINTIVNAFIKKYDEKHNSPIKGLTIEDLKHYPVHLNNENLYFVLAKDGSIERIGKTSQKAVFDKYNPLDNDTTTNLIISGSNTAFTIKDSLNASDIEINFPQDIENAFANIDNLIDNGNEFNFGKLDLQFAIDLQTNEDRTVTLAELMLFNSQELNNYRNATDEQKAIILKGKIDEKVGSIDNFNNAFYALLGVPETGKNLSAEAIEKLYTEKLASILIQEDQNKLKSAYKQYKTTATVKYLLQNLSDKKFTISAGIHGFKLKVRTDIRLNASIHKSTVAIELTDTSDNDLVLIGAYLLPSASVGYSDVLVDLSGIGMPKIMIGSLDLKSLIYNPFAQRMQSFLRDLSSKGIIGFIMDMVADKKAKGDKNVQAADVQKAALNHASYRTLEMLVLSNGKDKEVLFKKTGKTQLIQTMSAESGNKKLLDYVAGVINDSYIQGAMLNIVLSNENITGILSGIQALTKDSENNTTGLMLTLVKNLLGNSIEQAQLSIGINGFENDQHLESWSNIGGKLQIALSFKEDNPLIQANTKVRIGLDKLSLFFHPGEDYKVRINNLITARDAGEFIKLTELKKITVSTKIRLLIQSGNAGNLELIQFLKDISPDLKKKLEESEELFFKSNDPNKNFVLDVTSTEGFDLALQLSIELSARINALEDLGVTEEGFKNLASFAGLKVLFSKVNPDRLLRQLNAKIEIDVSKNINAVMYENNWRENPEWDRYDGKPFVTLMYDSETVESDGNVNGKGTLYINFGDDTLPDLKQDINLVELVNNKLKDLGANKKGNNKIINNDASGEGEEQNNAQNDDGKNKKKKEKAKLDATSLVLGVIGGISFTSKEFKITLANTALSVILKSALAGVKDASGNPVEINADKLPEAKISFGMSYATTGIGINLAITDILFGNTLSNKGGMKILLSISDLHLGVSKNPSLNYVAESDKDKYTSIDALVTQFNVEKLIRDYKDSGQTKGKYIAVNMALTTIVKLGNLAGEDYERYDFEDLFAQLNDLIENADENTISAENKALLGHLSGYLHYDGVGRELMMKISVSGRVNVSKLLFGVEKFKSKNSDPVQQAKDKSEGFKAIISALNVIISIQFSIKENQTIPDRILTLYVDGDNLKLYGRLYTNLQLEGQTVTDSKLMMSLAGDSWKVLERLFFSPKQNSNTLGKSSSEMSAASGEASNVVNAFKDYMVPLLENLKELKNAQNILGFLSAVKIGQQGIAVVTSAELVKTVLKALGVENPNIGMDITTELGVNLLPKEGGLVGVNVSVDVKNTATSKDIIGLKVGVPFIGLGLDFSDVVDTDSDKQKRLEKMLPIKQLGKERFLGVEFMNGQLSSYPDILRSGANNMRIGATLALNVDTANPTTIVSDSLKEVMDNFGLDITNLVSNFSMSPDEKLVLDFMIDVPLSQIANKILSEVNKNEYELDLLNNPAVKEKLKNVLLKGLIESVLNSSKIKIAIRSENSETHYVNNLLTLYYEGPSIGDFVYVKSSILGIDENGLKLNGAPRKFIPLITEKIGKQITTENSTSIYTVSDQEQQSIALELITKLLAKGAIEQPEVTGDAIVLELINGKMSLRLKTMAIQGLLQIFGVKMRGIDIYRFINGIGLEVEQLSNDTIWGISAFVTGKNGNKYTNAIKTKIELYNLFISVQKIGGELVPTGNATNVSLTSVNPQYVSLNFQVGLDFEGHLSNIEWNPTISLLVTILGKLKNTNISNENLEKIESELQKLIANKIGDTTNHAGDSYALEISARINIQDIFNYLERLDRAQKAIVETPGTYEYLVEMQKAKLNTNFQLTYASLGLTFKKKSQGKYKRLFGLIYDSSIFVNEISNSTIIKVPHEGIVFRGSEENVKVKDSNGNEVDFNFLSGNDIFFNCDNLGLHIISIINEKIVKSNKKALDKLEADGIVINNSVNNGNNNENSSTAQNADEIIDFINKITKNIAKLNIVDKATRENYSERIVELEAQLAAGTTPENEQAIKHEISLLKEALNEDNAFSLATTYMDIQKVLMTISGKLANATLQGALDEFADKYPDAQLNKIKVTADLSFPLNLKLGILFNKVEENEEIGLGVKIEVGGIGIKLNKTLADGIYAEDFIANLKPAKKMNVDVATSINLYIQSPEYLFSPNLNFDADSIMSVLSKLKTEIKMGAGFENETNAKHVKISIKARLNLGDIFDQVSARNYMSKIMLTIDISGYDHPFVIYTNLNDVLVDLSAFNMPKFKITDLDILTIVKGAIQAATDKAKAEAENPENNGVTTDSDNGNKGNTIQTILNILGFIEDVDAPAGSEYTMLTLKNDMVSELARKLLKLESGLEDFNNISLAFYKAKIEYGYGVRLGGVHLSMQRTLNGITVHEEAYAGGNFKMDVVIGKDPLYDQTNQVATTLGMYYEGDTSIAEHMVQFDIDENEFIPYNSLALKLRAETEIKFKSVGKPFMDIGGLLGLAFNSFAKGYTTADLEGPDGLKQTYPNVQHLFKNIDKLSFENDISNVSGIYSKTDSNTETTFRGYLNIDLPFEEIFSSENVADSKLKFQLLLVEDSTDGDSGTIEARTVLNITYSQKDKALCVEVPFLGISGVKLDNFDLLGQLKKNLKIKQIIESISEMTTGANSQSQNQEMSGEKSRDSGQAILRLSIIKEGINLSINSSVISVILEAVENKLDEDIANAAPADKKALEEKKELFGYIKDAIPTMSEIALKYVRPTNEQLGGESGKAEIKVVVEQGIKNETGIMVLELTAFLNNRPGTSFKIIDSYDSKKPGYETFYDQDPIVMIPASQVDKFTTMPFDKLLAIVAGAPLGANFPIKKLDIGFNATLDVKLTNDVNSPIKTLFDIIDKNLLNKTVSESGFVINEGKNYSFGVEARVILDFTTPGSFKNNSGIKLVITDDGQLLMSIIYIAKDNAIYIDLERIGLMKIKVTGINLLAIIGPTFFPENEAFIRKMAMDGATSEEIQDYEKIRAELDIRSELIKTSDDQVSGTRTKAVIKINDKFIKELLKRVASKKINELIVNNYSDYDTVTGKFENEEVQNVIDKQNKLLEIVEQFNFNDIMMSFAFKTQINEGILESGLEFIKVAFDLEGKKEGGRIYNTEDMANSDQTVNPSKGYIRIEANNFKIREFEGANGANGIYTNINDIKPTQSESIEYASLSMGDLKALVVGKDKSGLKALVFNVIQLITGQSGADFLDLGITNNTEYNGDVSKRELKIKANRDNTEYTRTVGQQGKVKSGIKVVVTGPGGSDINAYLSLDQIILKINSLSGATGTVGNIMGIITSLRIGLGPMLRDKLGAAFVPADEGGNTATPDEPIIEDNGAHERYTYSPGHGITSLLAQGDDGHLLKFLWSGYNYHYTKMIPISQLESIRIENDKWQASDNRDMFLAFWDKEGKYIGYHMKGSRAYYLQNGTVITKQWLANNVTKISGNHTYNVNNVGYLTIYDWVEGNEDLRKLTVVLDKKKPVPPDIKKPDGKVDISKVIKSIKVDAKNPKIIKFVDGAEIGTLNDTSLIVNLEPQFVMELINFANDSLFKLMGYPIAAGGDNSKMVVNAIAGFIMSMITSLDGRAMQFSNEVEGIIPAVVKLVKSIFPLPSVQNGRTVQEAYAKILLEKPINNNSKMLRAVQLKITTSNAGQNQETIEVLIRNNGGIKIDKVVSANSISLTPEQKTGEIKENIYSSTAISKTMSAMRLPGTTEATIQNKYGSYGHVTHSMDISWVQDESLGAIVLDPTQATDSSNNNYLVYRPYVTDVLVSGGQYVTIKLSNQGVRKVKVRADGKYDIYVKSGDEWIAFDYSKFENVLPGQRKLVIEPYINSITEIAVEMVNGNNSDVEGNDEITVGGVNKKLYVFKLSDNLKKFNFDISMIPQTINDYFDDESNLKNGKFSLTYGNGLVKNVMLEIPYTLQNIELNEDLIIEGLREYLKEITKKEIGDGKFSYNDPSMWDPTLIAKLQSKKALKDKVAFNENPYGPNYTFSGSALLPLRVIIENIDVEYLDDGTINPPSITDPIGTDIIENVILGLYVPSYRPIRIHLKNVVVSTATTLDGKATAEIGDFKLNKTVKLDLYPPYDVKKYSSLEQSTSQSMSGNSLNTFEVANFVFSNQSMAKEGSRDMKKQISISFKADTQSLADLYAADATFTQQLKEGDVTALMRFDSIDLENKILGTVDDNYLANWIVKIGEQEVTGANPTERIAKINEILNMPDFKNGEEILTYEQIKETVKCQLRFDHMGAHKVKYDEEKYYYIFKITNKGKIRVKFDAQNSAESAFTISILVDTNTVNAVNNIVRASLEFTSPDAAKWHELAGDGYVSDTIDIFYRNNITNIRKLQENKDQALEHITKINGANPIMSNINKYFTIIGTADKGFDSFNDIAIDFVDWDKNSFVFPAGTDKELILIKETSGRYNFSMTVGSVYRTNELNKLLAYNMSFELFKNSFNADGGRVSVTTKPGTIKFSGGKVEFADAENFELKDLLKLPETLYYLTSYKNKESFIEALTSFTVGGYQFNRYILRLKKIANYDFSLHGWTENDYNEENIKNLSGNDLLSFKLKYDVKEKFVTSRLGEISVLVFKSSTFTTLNDGSAGQLNLEVTPKGAVKFMTLGDGLILSTKLNAGQYKKIENGSNFDLNTMTITANIKKGDLNLYAVSKNSTTEIRDLTNEYSNNNIAIDTYLVDGNEIFNTLELKPEYDWGIASWEKDVLGNFVVKRNGEDLDGNIISSFALKYQDSDITSNFNIKFSTQYKKGGDWAGDIDPQDLKFVIKPMTIKIAIVLPENRTLNLPYLSVQPSYEISQYYDKYFEVIPRVKVNGSTDLSNLKYGDKLPAELDLSQIVLSENITLSAEQEEQIKKNFIFVNETQEKPWFVSVVKRRIYLNYNDINTMYSNKVIRLEDIITLSDKDNKRFFNEYLAYDKLFKVFKINIDGINVDLNNPSTYQNDSANNIYINALRVNALGSGSHLVKVNLNYELLKNEPFEIANVNSGQGNISIAKKPVKIQIGRMLKYYGQDIDPDKIPITFIGDGLVEWKEYENNGEEIKEIGLTDSISALGLKYYWKEEVGMQDIKLVDSESDNYDVDIEDTLPGEMDIRKTVIRLKFKAPMVKYVSADDPEIDPLELVYIDKRVKEASDKEDEAKLDELYKEGLFEIELTSEIFSGQLVRKPGEKKGEYRYSLGTLSVDSSKYELVFVDDDGNILTNGIEGDKNAVLKIQKNPKVMAPSAVRTLMALVSIISFALIGLGIIIRVKTKKIKMNKVSNNEEVK